MFVGAGALYSLLGAGAFTRGNQRDLSTFSGSSGWRGGDRRGRLLLDGVWLVLAYTVTAASLASSLRAG